MPISTFLRRTRWVLPLCAVVVAGCAPEYRPCWLGGDCGKSNVFSPLGGGGAFSEVLVDGRTFINGVKVCTTTYAAGDLARTPYLIDFNQDGRVDPVVAYAGSQIGVLQILMSYGSGSNTSFASLTLDGGQNTWSDLTDVAVGDINGDGLLDLIAATRDGVVYLRHPLDETRTHVLNEWGAESGELELVEGSTDRLTQDELFAIVTQALGPLVNLDDYNISVEQGYTKVELGDFNNDGWNDIAASRRLRVMLEPRPDTSVEPYTIIGGSNQILLNPGAAQTGEGWTAVTFSQHERHPTSDREGARDLRAIDIDNDGDLDVISTAADDANVQVAWFENPGGPGPVPTDVAWTQHRIGSVRGAFTVDVVDLTDDGRPDVVATSPEQMQVVLFVQPDDVTTRGYDWYRAPIITFESYEPRAIQAVDVDNDGQLELVVAGTEGALRYFEPDNGVLDEWTGHVVTTFNPVGDVGLLGYGDFDGDGDADLFCVIDGDDDTYDRVIWVRNELFP